MPPLVRTLFGNWIDYAGRFPPASLPLHNVVDEFVEAACPASGWFLRRLVLSPDDWREVESNESVTASDVPLPVSLVIGTGWDRLAAWTDQDRTARRTRLVSIEGRWNEETDWNEVASRLDGRTAYVEVAADPGGLEHLTRLRHAGLGAKLRCGGVRADQFPSAESLARFMSRCRQLGLAHKLTAGLHHLDPGPYRLTYEPDSPRGTMHGYLAVALAGLHLAEAPDDMETARQMLTEVRSADVRLESDALVWRGRAWDEAACRTLRKMLHGVGSCSFREPYEELQTWLA